MAQTKTQAVGFRDWLRIGLQRVSVTHFMLLVAYILQTIVMDAWHVITPQIVLQRWIAGAGLLAVVSGVWYLAHNSNNDVATHKRLMFALITADVLFASFNVYVQRGMAAKAVALFAVPIITSALLLSRAALFATAGLATAVYSLTAVSYFVLNFNEGYKTELYTEVGMYCALFFVLASLLSALVRFGGNTNNS